MFAYIKGLLTHSSSTSAVIEAGGVGYKICVPVSALALLPQIGTPCLLHTLFVVREQSQTLYGFMTPQERDFFEALIGVTGIGPKIALALIGHLSLSDLQLAIMEEDIRTLCRIPGIGKKGAERLVIEMRDKISLSPSSMMSGLAIHVSSDHRSQTISDAMAALINLGYSQAIAQKAIKKSLQETFEEIDVSSLIAGALQNV